MEWLTQFFQWGPDSMPRYMGLAALVFGVLVFLFIEGHALRDKGLVADESLRLKKINEAQAEKINVLEKSAELTATKQPLRPESNLNIALRNGRFGLVHDNPNELELVYKFSGRIQGGPKVGEKELLDSCALRSGGFRKFGSKKSIFVPFKNQDLIKDCRDIDLQVWLANASNKTSVRKFRLKFNIDGNKFTRVK